MAVSSQERSGYTTLLLVTAAFVAAVMVSNTLFSGWRLDLTENRLYTLSDGTLRIIDSVGEPINLYFFYSDQASESVVPLRTYALRVREMLEEFVQRSDGNLVLHVIDPLPFSEDEDRASQFGLQGISLGGDPIYLGLAATNTVGDEEIIAFFPPDRENFLEYEIARLVSLLASQQKTRIGLLSGAPIQGSFNPQTGQPTPAWLIVEQARQSFDVESLQPDLETIDEDIGILWVVHPLGLSEQALYGIDQFILGGGKAFIFVDPMAEAAAQPPAQQGMPPQVSGSSLDTLFDAWGIGFSGEVVGDPRLALRISGPGGAPISHPAMLGLRGEQLGSTDVVTADLDTINLASAGHFELEDGSELSLEPLFWSSDAAGTLDGMMVQFSQDPSQLFDSIEEPAGTRVLAARLSGTLNTAFPDGPPAEETDEGEGDVPDTEPVVEGEQDAEIPEPEIHLAESLETSNIILVGDVDMLADHLWVQVQNFFGQRIPSAFADNADFVINALDNLSGSADLITVRSRATSERPFTRVEGLRLDAEARFRETEQRLQAELSETEARLAELQSTRSGEDEQALLLSPEQQEEIGRFIDQRAAIRQELRAVQRNLDRDIDNLGTVLKTINVALIPLFVIILGLMYSLRSRRRAAS